MKKILTLLITILLLNFCLSADEDNCKTKDTDGKCTECNTGYTLKDGACVEDKDDEDNCKTKDSDGKCTECNTGYTLKDGACVEDKDSGSGSQGGSGSDSQGGSGSGTGSSNSNTGSGSDDSSFSLYSSLLLGLLTILF